MYGTLISTQTLASTTLGVTFSSIPATYTDLLLVVSIRDTGAVVQSSFAITAINGDTGSNYTSRYLQGTGSAAASGTSTSLSYVVSNTVPGASATTSTFGNASIYFPNYTSSTAKVFSIDGVMENNAATSYQSLSAGIWTGTAAINAIKVDYGNGGFAAGSTFSLYGLTHF